MIAWGLILLVVGLVVWAVGRMVRPPQPALVTVGYVIAILGAILLIVGLLLYAFATPATVDVDGLRALIGR